MLDPHREPDQAGGDAGGSLLLRAQLAVRRRGRVDDQAPDVADVRDVAVELERVDESATRVRPALDLEREHSARAARGVLLGEGVPRAALEAGVGDALDLVPTLQPARHRLSVLHVALDL